MSDKEVQKITEITKRQLYNSTYAAERAPTAFKTFMVFTDPFLAAQYNEVQPSQSVYSSWDQSLPSESS